MHEFGKILTKRIAQQISNKMTFFFRHDLILLLFSNKKTRFGDAFIPAAVHTMALLVREQQADEALMKLTIKNKFKTSLLRLQAYAVLP